MKKRHLSLDIVIATSAFALTFCDYSIAQVPAKIPDQYGSTGSISRDCAECPEIVRIPSVGHNERNPGSPFYVMKYELTWRQYIAAVKAGYCPPLQFDRFQDKTWPNDRLDQLEDDYPFLGISVDTFQCYLKFLKDKTGKTYRIPSAVEWEHAARAGTTTAYPWGDRLKFGDAILPNLYNQKLMIEKFGQAASYPRLSNARGNTFPVGRFPPNAWGLHDIIGNVGEITTERISATPGCSKTRDKSLCETYASRGFGGFFVSFNGPSRPFPEPGYNLMIERVPVPLHGWSVDGYRLVRN